MPSEARKTSRSILSSRPSRFQRGWILLFGKPLRFAQSEKEEITPLEGLPALSLDALTSVAYGPQAIVLVLAAAGIGALGVTLPITIGIALLLFLLVMSYRQVIEGFPHGGGAYAVARAELGGHVALLAGASLVVDYTLTVAVSISAGVAALVSAFQGLAPWTVPICLTILAVVTVANLRGLGESARAFLLPTAVFIIGLMLIIAIGIIHPLDARVVQPGRLQEATHAMQVVGVLLILKAFSAGCSALTGVEAIANGVPLFREPRVERAKQTELLLGVLLGTMLLGLAFLIVHDHIAPRVNDTVLSQIMAFAVGRGWFYFVISITITLVLALAANTSFGGLPVLANLLARDHYLPHFFAIRGNRLVYASGIWGLSLAAAILLVVSNGNTDALIPLFAIGVFIGFTLAQGGMVLHWKRHPVPGWRRRATLNGVGAVVTGAAAMIFLESKFLQGAWIVVVAVPAIIVMFLRIHHYYTGLAAELEIGKTPAQPRPSEALVLVLVTNISKLTGTAVEEAMSLSKRVLVVSVITAGGDGEVQEQQLKEAWAAWLPAVELQIVHTEYHSVVAPVVKFVRKLEAKHERVLVLIPEVEPRKLVHRLLHNQWGMVIGAALRRYTNATVASVAFHEQD